MRALLSVLLLLRAPVARAFRLPNLDINKLLDTAKNVGKATQDIAEPEEIAIGKDVASRLLGAAPLVADARAAALREPRRPLARAADRAPRPAVALRRDRRAAAQRLRRSRAARSSSPAGCSSR